MSSNSNYVQALAEALQARGVSVNDIGGISKSSSYQNMYRNDKGEMEVKELWTFQFAPVTFTGPAWEPVRPAPEYIVVNSIVGEKPLPTKFKTCVIVPDMQIGYYRDTEENLVPIHDEVAIDIALQMIKNINPNLIVCNGDNLDFPEFSKYRITPAFAQTTQAAIDRAALFAAQIRAHAPKARIIWLAGNHEERLPNYILDNATAAFGLKKGNHPSSWPVMSVPYLCNFDKYKIEYIPAYPANNFWINDNLQVIHGNKVKSSGSTAHMYLNAQTTSVIYGHVHRIEQAFKTKQEAHGPRTVMAASAGCLCRVDGAVPSTNGGKDLDGRPVKLSENWQQGLGVVKYEASGDHKFSFQIIPILNGWAHYEGVEYLAKK